MRKHAFLNYYFYKPKTVSADPSTNKTEHISFN